MDRCHAYCKMVVLLFVLIAWRCCEGNDGYQQLDSIPETQFSCRSRSAGYYADPDPISKCQVYHMCDGSGVKYSYLCPNRTLFDQKHLICNHWYDVQCGASQDHYSRNDDLFNQIDSKVTSSPSKAATNLQREDGDDDRINVTSFAANRKRNSETSRRVNRPSRPLRPGEGSFYSALRLRPKINDSKVIGVSIKSSIEAKTNPATTVFTPTSEITETTKQLLNTPASQSLQNVRNRQDVTVSLQDQESQIPTENISIDQSEFEDSSGYLSRDEFFDKISGVFGKKIPKVNSSTTDRSRAREEFIKLINSSQVFTPPKINRVQSTMTSLPVTIALEEPFPTVVDNFVTEAPESNEEPTTNNVESRQDGDDLVTGEHRACTGCMKYFIQDLDNCFPCVFPR